MDSSDDNANMRLLVMGPELDSKRMQDNKSHWYAYLTTMNLAQIQFFSLEFLISISILYPWASMCVFNYVLAPVWLSL